MDLVYGEEPHPARDAGPSGAEVTWWAGLEVLVRQGALSLSLWTGRDAPLAAMRRAASR